jgi:large subunit ribosomal protein L15
VTEKAEKSKEVPEIKLHQLRPAKGAKKNPKRVGRGTGSGHGKTSCRGSKGQRSRSGSGVRPGFEGGQMPLARRLPKRGFTNIFRVEYQVVNVDQLGSFDTGTEVDVEALRVRKLVRRAGTPVKILGKGELTQPVTVKVHAVSEGARKKIEAAGGKVELLDEKK